MVKAHPDIREIESGRVLELVQRATGAPMRMEPYLAYLRGKYGELYQLPDQKRREAAA